MILAQQLLLSCATGFLIASSSGGAQSATVLSADIPPQSLTHALTAFAQQTGLQLIYVSAIAGAQQSKGARAGLSLSDALTHLLDATGLQFEFLNARMVKIYAPPIAAQPVTRIAPVADPHAARQPAARALALEEVIVTATRREERATNVPISMAVWTQEAMQASGIKGITEIGAMTPGVEFDFDSLLGGGFATNLIIRGVTDRHGTTTGVYIDDTPVPAGRGDTFLRSFPWAFDLNRVEVLRGPQGTLLGQGTLGGAVRFITNQPSLTTFSGLARTEFSMTARGDLSYEAGTAAGGPLVSNVLGLRVSGWYRTDGGFIDRINPFNGATVDANANRQLSKSARIALAWAPASSMRITPSLDYESFHLRDSPGFYQNLSNPEAGQLRNGNLERTPFNDSFYLASVKLNAGLGRAELSTVTSYFHSTATGTVDASSSDPVSYADAAAIPFDGKQRMFSQEARLTSADSNASLTWIAGALYSSERKREATWLIPAGGSAVEHDATVVDQTRLEGFGQIGLRITNRVTVNAGLRTGRTSYDWVIEAPSLARDGATETGITPRFNLSYQTEASKLLYLTVAKGYRSGGVYPPLAGCGESLDVFPPDTVWSYEIGAKEDLWGGRVHLEPSVFHIRWNNVQPDAFTLTCNLLSQRGTGVSNGFDFAAQALVTEHVKVGLALGYTDAHFTQTATVGEAVILHVGDALGALPRVPSPWNVIATVEYKFALKGGVTANVRADDVFHSRNPGPFYEYNPVSPFYDLGSRPDPSINLVNLRAGVQWAGFDLALSVNNALDSQPTLGRRDNDPTSPNPIFTATTFRPRTLGLSATWHFDRSPRSD